MSSRSIFKRLSILLFFSFVLVFVVSCNLDNDIKDGIPAVAQIKQVQQGNKKVTLGVTEYYQLIIDADIITKEGRSWPVRFKEMVALIDLPKIQPGKM